MDRTTAQARLELFGEVNTEPVLSPDEVDILLDMAKEIDKYSVYPTDAGWTETYNANSAIAHAWLLKASRLAPRYLFMSGGKMLSRQQFYDHCIKQYKIYIGKAGIRAIRFGSDPLGLANVPNNADV